MLFMPLDMPNPVMAVNPSIHVPSPLLPTCMYGGSMADVYENNGMKSIHKSRPLLINGHFIQAMGPFLHG